MRSQNALDHSFSPLKADSKQINPNLRIKAPMLKQISAKETNMNKAVKKSPTEPMVVKLVSIVSHSKCDVVVKIEKATESDIHLKNSAAIKIYTSLSVHKKVKKIIATKTPYTMKISLKRSYLMLSAVAVRIPYSVASNKSPTRHRITKIAFVLGFFSHFFSVKHLIKRNVKSHIRKSQSHPQSHIFEILTSKFCFHQHTIMYMYLLGSRTCFGFIYRCIYILEMLIGFM